MMQKAELHGKRVRMRGIDSEEEEVQEKWTKGMEKVRIADEDRKKDSSQCWYQRRT